MRQRVRIQGLFSLSYDKKKALQASSSLLQSPFLCERLSGRKHRARKHVIVDERTFVSIKYEYIFFRKRYPTQPHRTQKLILMVSIKPKYANFLTP